MHRRLNALVAWCEKWGPAVMIAAALTNAPVVAFGDPGVLAYVAVAACPVIAGRDLGKRFAARAENS